MSREATSEQSLVREGAGYDEVFDLGHEPESFSWSSERETSAQSPDEEVGSYGEEGEKEIVSEEGEVEEGEEERDSDGNGDEGDEESYEGTLGSLGGNRPFILSEDWTVSKFLPKRVTGSSRSCVLVTRSQTISQFVSQGKTKGAIWGGPRTSACMMPCLLQGLDYH